MSDIGIKYSDSESDSRRTLETRTHSHTKKNKIGECRRFWSDEEGMDEKHRKNMRVKRMGLWIQREFSKWGRVEKRTGKNKNWNEIWMIKLGLCQSLDNGRSSSLKAIRNEMHLVCKSVSAKSRVQPASTKAWLERKKRDEQSESQICKIESRKSIIGAVDQDFIFSI